MSGRQQLLAIFLPATRPQAEDAIAVARELAAPTWIVPVWTGVLDGLGGDVAKLPFPPLVRRLAPELPRRLLRMALIQRGRALVRQVARRPQPPVLVFGDDVSWVEAAMAKLATELGLPTLLIQDGLLDERDSTRLADGPSRYTRLTLAWLRRRGTLPADGQYLYGSTPFRRVAAYSDFARDLMVRWGARPEAVEITGAPRFDALFREPPPPPPAGDRPVLLYIGLLVSARAWAGADTDERWLEAVAAAARAHPDWRIVLRPHPVDDVNRYRLVLDRMPGGSAVELEREPPIHYAIAGATAVAMHFPSTVMVEALAMDRPVAFVHLGLERLETVYERDAGLVQVTSPAAIGEALSGPLASSEGRLAQLELGRDLLTRYLGLADGRSAARVAALVRELAG